ncbi:hypothetical protein [Ralstonia solanacearum]|uniref:hypothetical protein n=1 Tax=Ralstonia solanacearum TaxID=305 RepID=UPI0012D42FB6|nr:hypothetical protein [Ralstonia solanacearum]MDB0554129.1 hypothetical protein [Ralstonia solanacearum]
MGISVSRNAKLPGRGAEIPRKEIHRSIAETVGNIAEIPRKEFGLRAPQNPH